MSQGNPLESPRCRTDVQLASPSGLKRLALQKTAAMIELTVFFDGSKLNKFRQLRQHLAKIGVHSQSIRQLRQNMTPSSTNSRAEEYSDRSKYSPRTTRHGGRQFFVGDDKSSLPTNLACAGCCCIFEEVGMRCGKHPCCLCVRGTKTVNLLL